jgi:hypothetical protein
MKTMNPIYIENIYTTCKEEKLSGRWITLNHIEKTFSKLEQSDLIQLQKIGSSEEDKDIYEFTLGKGPKKILIWSQMHGNESTGTKAIFDLLNYFTTAADDISDQILNSCTIKIIPILNPDGAQYYTRVNANLVDLNRDAVTRKAKESQLLRSKLEEFQPDFCFNLHDQRTIFGVEGTENPATISFLAPSEEVTRKITKRRIKTMNVIVAMNTLLQEIIPNHVGLYTDEFYPTATGDNFQKLGYPTILIESGHYPNDYEREETRRFTFASILKGIHHISIKRKFKKYEAYFDIPNNQENFRDELHRFENKPNEAYQFVEILEENELQFVPEKVEDNISELLFHKEIDFVS